MSFGNDLQNNSTLELNNPFGNETIHSAVQTTKNSLARLDDIVQVRSIDFIKINSSECSGKNSQLTDEEKILYQKILCLRKDYYVVKAPHLLTDEEMQIERSVDQRSVLFAILQNDVVLSTLRLTEKPFELENFNIHCIDINKFNDYLEIGRLVTSLNIDQIMSSLIVRHLLCAAGLWAIEEYHAKGFVAICRPFRIKFFNKFGLMDLASFYSNQRKINYHFLAASMNEILFATAHLQKSETAFRRRIQNGFSKT